jgi:hypothetical protein
MAVRTQKNALARLCANGGQGSRQTAFSNPEPFRGGVAVMELQRAYVSVVATDAAAPASF